MSTQQHVFSIVQPAEVEHLGKDWITVDVVTGEPSYRLRVRVARREDGQLICTGLQLGANGEEVTARGLRRIPMSQLLRFITDVHKAGPYLKQFGWKELPLNRTRAGSGGLPREHFEDVAKGYREALQAAPRAPIKYLAQRWHHPMPTIRRWVRQSRDMGLLGAATQGRAGERPVPRGERHHET